jgi:TolB-like protein/DNA-binding winged helix-turn-helix (wHTH) protein/Flp pilus assembly protein TadD
MEAATASAKATTPTHFQVEDLYVDVERRQVMRGEVELLGGGLSFDVFLALLQQAPRVVSLDDLMRQAWPGLVVGPEAVSQRIKVVRRALSDNADSPRYLAGVRGRGYRMVAHVAVIEAAHEAATASRADSAAAAAGAGNVRRRRYLAGGLALGALLVAAAVILAHPWRREVAGAGIAVPEKNPIPHIIGRNSAVAVLPFVNLTGDVAKEYVGDGMAEEVINMLAQIPGLKVPARTSSFAYKGRSIDVRQIASDLGVGMILEGSVREAGARIRVTAELINAQDGLHLWSQSYDRKFTDLFQLQDDLASAIVQALAVKLGGSSKVAITPTSRSGDIEAYDLYLQGEAALARPTPQSFQRAAKYLQAAVARDPTLAAAYARLGTALFLSGENGVRPIEEVAAAERAANQAIKLDPVVAEAQEVLSNVSRLRGNWLEAETYARKAISLSPEDANTHLVEGYLLDEVGQLRASLAEFDQAYALAPANLAVISLRSYSQSLLGRDVDALKSARLAEDLGLPRTNFSVVYEQAALHSGHYADATAAALDFLNITHPDEARTREIVELVYGTLANPSRKPAAMAAGARLYPPSRGQAADSTRMTNAAPCLQSSYAFAFLGELDTAYSMADRCLNAMAPAAINSQNQRLWTANMRPFREDARFPAFATRLGLVQYWRKYGPPDECALADDKLSCH